MMDSPFGTVPENADIIEIDVCELEQLLAIPNGIAEFMDQDGNTIQMTAEQLRNAGFRGRSSGGTTLRFIVDQSTDEHDFRGTLRVTENGCHERPPPDVIDEYVPPSENIAKPLWVPMDEVYSQMMKTRSISTTCDYRRLSWCTCYTA
uniref:Uncharacterized protein n=1 Tax=Trichuris muris TaxID=70415 RepID=A0A5S6Q2C7_TRIMR